MHLDLYLSFSYIKIIIWGQPKGDNLKDDYVSVNF